MMISRLCHGTYLRRRYCAESVKSGSSVKNGISELCPPDLFITNLLHQNEGFNNLKTRGFEVNKEKATWKKKMKNVLG